jgi:hypothetical protein
MNGAASIAGGGRTSDANRRVVPAGDFDCDAKSDLVRRNRSPGQTML